MITTINEWKQINESKNRDIIITIPKNTKWEDYKKELAKARQGQSLNFKVAQFPKTGKGNKCYICYNGNIIGYHFISQLSNKAFTCTTTGRNFSGKFVERTGKFYKIEPIPMKGFQGYRYFDNITESVEFNNDIRFENLHIDFHNDQHVYKLKAYINNKLVGFVDYHLYRGEVFIDLIESLLPKHNIGPSMMKYLADKYGYENIERTHFTEAGMKLRQKMDDYYNFDYDEYKKSLNKHIDKSEIDKIKYPLVKQFLNDILLFGYNEAWKKNLDKIRNFNNPNLELDFNEIADISEWIKNSPTNDNDPQDEVPDVIMNDLQKLK